MMEHRAPARRRLGAVALGPGLLLLVALPTFAMDAEVQGIEGRIADNVEVYLEGLDGSQYRVERLRNEVARLTQEAMRGVRLL